MRIAIDLDDTLFDNTIPFDVIKDLNLDPALRNQYTYHLKELGTEGHAECQKRFKMVEHMCAFKPTYGSKKKIKEWHSQKIYMACVTARDEKVKWGTVQMVQKHFPQITSIVLLGTFDKTEHFKENNYDIVIDDRPETLFDALKVGVKKCFLIRNHNTPHNHGYDIKDSRIVPVKGLKDIKL